MKVTKKEAIKPKELSTKKLGSKTKLVKSKKEEKVKLQKKLKQKNVVENLEDAKLLPTKLQKKLKQKNVVETLEEDAELLPTKLSNKSKSNKASKKTSKPIKEPSKKKKSHKDDLEGLKDIDPEFYDFLKKNDKELLEFNLYDDSDDEATADEAESKVNGKAEKKDKKKSKKDKHEEASDDDEDNEKYHKPSSADLELASDESDFEAEDDDDEPSGVQKVTLNLLRQWQTQLEQQSVPIVVLRKVISAFSSALASLSADVENEKDASSNNFKVTGAAAFNGVVQLCVLHLQPAILRFLGQTTRSTLPLHKTKKWTKVRSCLRCYLADLISLIEQVSGAHILQVLLKHLHQMASMIACFSTLGKTILKRLIVLWSTGDEAVRVLAFLCILKITRNQQASMLNHVLKAMYLSYVRNSKFVSPNTLPSINFMRRSLVEMFALDLNVSYQHVFLYIRQLAIHLRNAVILKKKDSFQAVYNWQYVNSLRLWVDLLGATANKPQLQPLTYPLVTIATGVIRLVPTAQYFPLRFHCVQALISLSKQTHTYIPVLPFLLEVLRSNTFNKKHTNVSMRPTQFVCILRLNKTQLSENGFRDEVVEQVCGLALEYLAHESASLAYCDLIVPSVVALKAYLKDCRNANHTRKLKQLLDKMQENARFIEQERRKITFGLKDLADVRAWESKTRNKGTPLAIYYASWVKTHETKKRRQATQADVINSDYDLPMIKRRAKGDGVAVKNENGEVELFPSDSEDDEVALPGISDDEEQLETEIKSKKQNSAAKKDKSNKRAAADAVVEEKQDVEEEEVGAEELDIVKDLDLDDW